MPYELANRLVIGVASSALFDLTQADSYFKEFGEAEYRKYQDENLDVTLGKGVAFPFVKGLLGLNNLRPTDPVVEIIVLSRNDPSTGLRVMRSVQAHGLEITRAVFTQGRAPYRYIPALDMSLFLSGSRSDVDAAVNLGFPAGHVLPSAAQYDESEQELRIAFDFDGVLASDEAERVYKSSTDISEYMTHESDNKSVALAPGPLHQLLADLNRIQDLEEDRRTEDPTYVPRLRIAIVTARNSPAHERAIQSLRQWGLAVNDAFFLGGIAKSRILEVMRPHIFFDDQVSHLDGAANYGAAVHVPYGIANEEPVAVRPDIAWTDRAAVPGEIKLDPLAAQHFIQG